MPRKIIPNMSTPIMGSSEYDNKMYTEDKSVNNVLKRFAVETTAHGPFHIAISQNCISKIFWTIMLIFAASILSWQTYELVAEYYDYDTVSELVHSDYLPFPAVTVCNVNKMKRSLMTTNKRFSEVVRIDGGWDKANFKEYDWFWEELPPWWQDYSERLNETLSNPGDATSKATTKEHPGAEKVVRSPTSQPDDDYASTDDLYYDFGIEKSDCDDEDHQRLFNDLGASNFLYGVNRIFTPTREELKTLGHRKEDFILQCSLNGIKCSHRNFTTFQNSQYGNCFTFNGTHGNITKAGSYYGLHLTLFIEEPEYVGVFSEETGARICVHSREEYPHLEDLGITLPPGFSTQIGVRKVEIKRLNLRNSVCSRGEIDGHATMQSQSYNIISCQKRCLQDAMRQNCNCVSEIYEHYDGERVCSCKDERCRQSVENLYATNRLSCNCPPPCREVIYNTQVSSSHWPARRYQEHLISKLRESDREAARILEDHTAVRNNLVRVKIYFQELNYERNQQSPKHTVPSLFGAIGGIFGLYVGFSIFTFAEILVLIVDITKTVLFRGEHYT